MDVLIGQNSVQCTIKICSSYNWHLVKTKISIKNVHKCVNIFKEKDQAIYLSITLGMHSDNLYSIFKSIFYISYNLFQIFILILSP